jgi:isoleucyl-tRNA synthetase
LLDERTGADWNTLLTVRAAIVRAIEPLRKAGNIGHSLDTRVTLFADAATRTVLERLGADLRAVCIVSQFALSAAQAPAEAVRDETDGVAVLVERAWGSKCERCWIYTEEAGIDPTRPGLCPRCTDVMRRMEQA